MDAVPDTLIVVSHEGTILWINNRAVDLLGYSLKELQGQAVETLLPDHHQVSHSQHRSSFLSYPQHRPMAASPEIEAKPKSGKLIPVDIEINKIDWFGVPGVMASLRSRLKLLETEAGHQKLLRENEERLRRSQGIAKIGTWDWNIKQDKFVWSDQIHSMFGWEKARPHICYQDFIDIIHPDDKAHVQSIIDEAVIRFQPYSMEHRIVREDGLECYVKQMGEVYLDETGAPTRMLGTVQDISDEHQRDLKLQLSQAIFDNADEGILSTDERFNLVAVNPAMIRMCGFRETELIGRSLTWLLPKKDSYFHLRPMLKTIRSHGSWKGQVEVLCKNRPNCPVLVSAAFIKDVHGLTNQFAFTLTDISQLKLNEEQLENLAHYDQLTKLPNRTLFLDRLEQQIRRAKVKPKKFSVHYLDLDGFKQINDSQGHSAGDELLFEVAEQLRAVAPDNCFVARLGGDEFAILQLDCTEEDAERLAKLVIRRLQLRKHFSDFSLDISASIGISHFPKDGEDSLELIKSADQAMYQSKHLGRNTFQHYQNEVGDLLQYKLQLSSDIAKAVASNSFELYFQPKRIMNCEGVTSAEALIRWFHPVRGSVSPVDFIPLAEENGQILAIGEQVMVMACRFIQVWNERTDDPIRIAINISARQLQDKDLLTKFQHTMDAYGVTGEQIEFEITESVAMQNKEMEYNLKVFERMKKMGSSIALDDFGTGYSSFSYLKRLPVDIIKIDRSFVASLPDSESDLAIVEAIVSMAHTLNIKVVAEGVETFEQARVLVGLGCDELQGFYLGRPQTPEQLLDGLNKLRPRAGRTSSSL